MSGYPVTHYALTREDDVGWPVLSGRHETETCVVGGGLAGLATAHALAARGRAVVLLEARRVGWGASGRNGGFASPGYPLGMPTLGARFGEETALALWRLSTEALGLVRQRAEAMGPGVLEGQGALRCRMRGSDDDLPGYVATMNERFGARLEYLPPERLRTLVRSDSYEDGYLNHASLQIHPLNFTRGMARLAVGAGARIVEGSPALRLERAGGAHVVHTAQGSVSARNVVLAGGGYLRGLHARLGLAIVPVASFVMATEPAPDLLEAVIPSLHAVSDTRVATDYYRRLPDGRLLWGGRASAIEWSPPRLTRLLARDMALIHPSLAALRVETAWSGLMPIARHRMPVIGELEKGMWAATGFAGLGMATTTLAGELIGGAIAGEDDRHRLFAPFGTPFAGGLAGRAAFQAIYWRHQIMDWRAARRRHGGAAPHGSA